jgi:Mn-dependent DtxR family transcriptional regulator
MPVDLRKHDPDDPITIRPETNKAKIIKLLYRDTNLGYTPAEIREALELPRGSVSTTLSRMQDEGLIGKTSDGLYHGLDHRNDIRRFARSLVSLDTMLSRHPEAGIEPDDVEQTDESAKEEIPPERLQQSDVGHDEPSPSEWIVEDSAEDTDG